MACESETPAQSTAPAATVHVRYLHLEMVALQDVSQAPSTRFPSAPLLSHSAQHIAAVTPPGNMGSRGFHPPKHTPQAPFLSSDLHLFPASCDTLPSLKTSRLHDFPERETKTSQASPGASSPQPVWPPSRCQGDPAEAHPMGRGAPSMLGLYQIKCWLLGIWAFSLFYDHVT